MGRGGTHKKTGIGKLSELDAKETKKNAKKTKKMCNSSGVQEYQDQWDTRAESVCEAEQREYAKYV